MLAIFSASAAQEIEIEIEIEIEKSQSSGGAKACQLGAHCGGQSVAGWRKTHTLTPTRWPLSQRRHLAKQLFPQLSRHPNTFRP